MTNHRTFAPTRCILLLAICAATVIAGGCLIQPPGGAPITPRPLGSVVDEANMTQEANAEIAKLIVYTHEFEVNEQNDQFHPDRDQQKKIDSSFNYRSEPRVRGIRLNPYGQDHLRQIARILSHYSSPNLAVIVERSETSKKWLTKHRYPVHFNDELDEIRRQIVVAGLSTLGIENAEEMVVIAPAFTTGLNANEAATAYRRALGNSGTFSFRGGVGGFF